MTSGPSNNTGLDIADYYLEASADLLPSELVHSLVVDLQPQMSLLARELDLPAESMGTVGFSRWCRSPGSTVFVLVMVLRNLGRVDCVQKIIQYLEMHLMQLYIKVEAAAGGVVEFHKVKTSGQFSLVQALENTLGGDLAHYKIVGPGPWVSWSTLARELKGKQLTLVRHLYPVPETKQALYGTPSDCCLTTSLAFPEITDWPEAPSLEETHVKEFDHTQMENLKFGSSAIPSAAINPWPESSHPTSRSNNETPVDSVNGQGFEAMQTETSSILFSLQDKHDNEEQTISKTLVKKPIAGKNNIPEYPQIMKIFPDKRMDIESDTEGVSHRNLLDTMKNGPHYSQPEQNIARAVMPEQQKIEWASNDVSKLHQQLAGYNYENFAQEPTITHASEINSQSGDNLTNFNNLSQRSVSLFLSDRATQNSAAQIRTVSPGSKGSTLVLPLPLPPSGENDLESEMIVDNLPNHSPPGSSLLSSSDLRESSLFDDNRNHSDLSLFQTQTGYVSHKYIESIGQGETAVKHTEVVQSNGNQLTFSNLQNQVSLHAAAPKQHSLSHVCSSTTLRYRHQVEVSNQRHSPTSMKPSSFNKNNNNDEHYLKISSQNQVGFGSQVCSSQTSPTVGNVHIAPISVMNSKQVNSSPLRTTMAFGELSSSSQASPRFSQVNITSHPSQTLSAVSNAENLHRNNAMVFQIHHSPRTVSDFHQFQNMPLTMSSNEFCTTSPLGQTQHRLQTTSSSSSELSTSLSTENRQIQLNTSPQTVFIPFQGHINPSFQEHFTGSSGAEGGHQISENSHQSYHPSVTSTRNYCSPEQQQLYSHPRKFNQQKQPGTCIPLVTPTDQPHFLDSQSLSQVARQNQCQHQNNMIPLLHFSDISDRSEPGTVDAQQLYCPMLPPVEVKVRIPQVAMRSAGEQTQLVINPKNYQANPSVLGAASLLPPNPQARFSPRIPSSGASLTRDARDNDIIIDEEGYNLIDNGQVGARASSNTARRTSLPPANHRRGSLNLEAELSQIKGWCPHENGDTIMSTMDRYLAQDGSFVVWKSRRSATFIISVSHLKRVFHFRVEETTNASKDRPVYYLFEGGFRSESLLELVQHYQQEDIKISMTASKGVKKYIEHIGLRYPIKSEAKRRNVPKNT